MFRSWKFSFSEIFQKYNFYKTNNIFQMLGKSENNIIQTNQKVPFKQKKTGQNIFYIITANLHQEPKPNIISNLICKSVKINSVFTKKTLHEISLFIK